MPHSPDLYLGLTLRSRKRHAVSSDAAKSSATGDLRFALCGTRVYRVDQQAIDGGWILGVGPMGKSPTEFGRREPFTEAQPWALHRAHPDSCRKCAREAKKIERAAFDARHAADRTSGVTIPRDFYTPTTYRFQVSAQNESVAEARGGFPSHEAAKAYGLKRRDALGGKWVSVSAELDDATWTRYRAEVQS